jgi:hypothetical protein
MPIYEYLTPNLFIKTKISHCNSYSYFYKVIKINNIDVGISSVLQALTEDEFKVMIDIWQNYKLKAKRTPKQQEDNLIKLASLEIFEDPEFFNTITVMDVLT